MLFSIEEAKFKLQNTKGFLTCPRCGLYKKALSPKMEPYGRFKKKILNIGEAPGRQEDWRGKQWQGKMGRKLQGAYRSLGIDLFDDCLNINAVNCRPIDSKGDNRPPSPHEIASCRKRVADLISQYKPKVVILHGSAAVQSIISYRIKRNPGGISKWRNWTIPDRDFRTWLCPVFHPSYVSRGEKKNEEIETIWMQDLKKALSMRKVPFPTAKKEKDLITIIEDKAALYAVLSSVMKTAKNINPPMLAFDYETTGIKPHLKGHKIASMSLCNDPNRAYSFLMPETGRIRGFIKDILRSRIPKVAHNIKFEDTWSKVIMGVDVNNWLFDSMLGGHILDNRTKTNSLKLQVYLRFGIVDYESEVEPWLKSKDKKDGNAFNNILAGMKDSVVREKILLYGGIDSLLCYRLAALQMKEIGIDWRKNANYN